MIGDCLEENICKVGVIFAKNCPSKQIGVVHGELHFLLVIKRYNLKIGWENFF